MDLEDYVTQNLERFGYSDGRNKKLIYGFGVNDAAYVTQSASKGWHCPHFRAWQGVMTRSFCGKFKARRPTYRDCGVYEGWLRFTTYLSWSLKNYVEGWALDKDLLVRGNKTYGPDTCAFVPTYLNNLVKTKITDSNGLPLGVSREGGYKKTYIRAGAKRKSVGGYRSAHAAHRDWQMMKVSEMSDRLLRYAQEPVGFRTDVADAINARIWDILLDHSKNTETTFI